jgi:uncharacterized Zn finger protein
VSGPDDREGTSVPVDRRRNRLTLDCCHQCGSDAVRVVTRTEYVVYVRCDRCGHVASIAKPGSAALS